LRDWSLLGREDLRPARRANADDRHLSRQFGGTGIHERL
jgi:hypothetical protein